MLNMNGGVITPEEYAAHIEKRRVEESARSAGRGRGRGCRGRGCHQDRQGHSVHGLLSVPGHDDHSPDMWNEDTSSTDSSLSDVSSDDDESDTSSAPETSADECDDNSDDACASVVSLAPVRSGAHLSSKGEHHTSLRSKEGPLPAVRVRKPCSRYVDSNS